VREVGEIGAGEKKEIEDEGAGQNERGFDLVEHGHTKKEKVTKEK